MSATNRIQTPDLLRGSAVILMIQVHIMELFASQELYDGFAGELSLLLGGVPAAPVFMIVMGYFLAFGQKEPVNMMIRGVKLFMAGVVLNIGLNAHLIYRVLNDGWQVNIWHYIFGVDILHLAGLSMILIAFLNLLCKRNFLPYMIAALVVAFSSSFIPAYANESGTGTYLMAFVHSKSEWSYFPLIPWLAYPLTGYSFKLFEEKYLREALTLNIRVSLTAVLSVFLIFTVNYAVGISHRLDVYYHHDAVFYSWSLAFVVFWAFLFSFTEKAVGNTVVSRYVKWLGVNVTSVFIFQWLIIGNIATAVYKTQGSTALVLWFIGITVFTSTLTLSWNKTKSAYDLSFLKL
jgi:uncharacterized membrane protein